MPNKVGRQKLRQSIFAGSTVMVLTWVCPCLAQNDSDVTRHQWKVQIEEARRRVDILRKEHKLAPPPPSIGQSDDEAAQSILNDDSLEAGDIVSMQGALYRFNGRSNSDDPISDFTFLGKAGQDR